MSEGTWVDEDGNERELPDGFHPGPLWSRYSKEAQREEVLAWLDRQRRNAEADSPSWNGRRW